MKLWFGEPRPGRPLGGSLWEPVLFILGIIVAIPATIAMFLVLVPLTESFFK